MPLLKDRIPYNELGRAYRTRLKDQEPDNYREMTRLKMTDEELGEAASRLDEDIKGKGVPTKLYEQHIANLKGQVETEESHPASFLKSNVRDIIPEDRQGDISTNPSWGKAGSDVWEGTKRIASMVPAAGKFVVDAASYPVMAPLHASGLVDYPTQEENENAIFPDMIDPMFQNFAAKGKEFLNKPGWE
jgi:hypothetical protein